MDGWHGTRDCRPGRFCRQVVVRVAKGGLKAVTCRGPPEQLDFEDGFDCLRLRKVPPVGHVLFISTTWSVKIESMLCSKMSLPFIQMSLFVDWA